MRWLPLALALSALTPAAAHARTKVAVMDLKNVQGVPEGTATILTEIVVSEVARYGLDVVSKADIAAIVGFEKEKTLLGCSEDSSCLAEIGGALGVDFMLTGQVGQIGSRYRISLILVDVKKGKVAGRAADFCDRNEDALANAAVARVREIVGIIQATGASKPPPTATRPASTPSQPPVVALKPAEPPPPAAVPLPAEPPVPEEPSTPWSRRKILGLSLTGAGGLAIVGGIVAGLKAKSLEDDLSASSNDLYYYYDYPAARDDVEQMALVADVLYGVGAVAAGAGVYFWLTDKPAPVVVAPMVGDGQAGVVAAGRF